MKKGIKHSGKKRVAEETVTGYLFMAPTILIAGVFLILPIAYAVALAFQKVQLLGDVSYQFTGLKNFARIAQDDRVWIALKNTASYVAIVVPIQTILALMLALILNSQIKGRSWFRVAFFLPTVTSSAVLTLIFMWIYNSNGLLNSLLSLLHLPTYNWLGDPNVALKGIMIMNIWSTAPLFMVIYLAALQGIPETLYEAATLDGASQWEKFLHITLPFLQPVTFLSLSWELLARFNCLISRIFSPLALVDRMIQR